MTIFIKYDALGIVNYQHHMPFDESYGLHKSQPELELEGILVESIPEPIPQAGRAYVLHVDLVTKELYYQYEDVPPTPEEEMIEVKNTQAQVVLALVMGGLM